MKLIDSQILFWQSHPALFHGVTLLLGSYLANHLYGLIPLFALWAPFIIKAALTRSTSILHPLWISLILLISAAGFYNWRYIDPPLPNEGIRGNATITIQSLQLKNSFFNQKWHYQCQLKSFIPTGSSQSIAHSIDCSITLPYSKKIDRPLADRDYLIQGTLIKTERGNHQLKISTKDPWKSIQGSYSFSEIRYQAKQGVKKWIQKHIKHPSSAAFLAGLATGEFDNKRLAEDFSRFGLQHIMAISGFHFAIIAAILSFFLRLVLSHKMNALMIVFFLSLYFIFLGLSPSILRAWVMISLAMGGLFLEKSPKALNLMGVALIVALIIDPQYAFSLGFQLSFLITAAILLCHSSIEKKLIALLPKRPLSEMVEMPLYSQHAYVLLSLFRQGLSLTIAVNLFAFPALLYYFNQFPLLSLIYNFFFPFLVSLSMFLLIVSIFIPWVHDLNNLYTEWVLGLAFQMPPEVDYYFRIESFPLLFLVGYLTLATLLAIHYKQPEDNEFTFV